MEKRELSAALKGKYKMIGYLPGEFVLRNGNMIDTRYCSVEEADAAIATGCSFIKKISLRKKK